MGPMLIPIALYLGYREVVNPIMFYRSYNYFYLRAFACIMYHVLYYGPTYFIVINSLYEIDKDNQNGQMMGAGFAVLMYFFTNFYFSNQIFSHPAYIL